MVRQKLIRLRYIIAFNQLLETIHLCSYNELLVLRLVNLEKTNHIAMIYDCQFLSIHLKTLKCKFRLKILSCVTKQLKIESVEEHSLT